MFVITIEKNIKLEDVESYYDKLYSHINKNLTVDLLLPNELDNYYLGLIPALYQFTITWSRYKKSGKLLLNIKTAAPDVIDKLYENELLFPVISYVWNKNQVFNKTGDINLRDFLKAKNAEIFDKMKSARALKGKKLLLTNFDHLPAERGLLDCFVEHNEFLKNETKLAESLSIGISEVLSHSLEGFNQYKKVGDSLIGIIYELMKNTFEWAREDENKVPLDPNLRGLLMKFYKKKRITFLNEFKKHPGLYNYFQSENLKENVLEELFFLEISVFDSGIGFVDKYKSLNDSSNLTNIDIVKKCMITHMTSAKGMEKDDKGLGLDRILSIINGKGFLRIKTSDVCVYRNAISHPYKSVDKVKDMELFDWNKNSNKEYSSYRQVEGSVVTIIYPLMINE